MVKDEDRQDHGLYRYLLTAMDGLESAGAERICVMMTATYASVLPAALQLGNTLQRAISLLPTHHVSPGLASD